MTVGEQIRTLRRAAGWTQAELGQRLDVDKSRISEWEHDRVMPGTATFFRIRGVCQVAAGAGVSDNRAE